MGPTEAPAMRLGIVLRFVDVGVDALAEAREEIDALNVFPVPDGDTGTNMFLTMESASVAMDEAFAALPEEIAGTDEQVDAMAALSGAIIKGALLGARGNSGVILSQILRGMVKVDPISGNSLKPTAEAVRAGLRQAADMAYAAVGKPKEGTILSVIRAAAETAAATDTDDLEVMIEAVARGAREALARTPEQLDVLKRAGVVDSGGRGMVVIMDALAEVVTGRRAPAGPAQARVPQPEFAPGTDYDGPPFEVMYLLDARDDAIPRLKEELSDLGDSLVVVGGDGLWNIHVHVTDAGAAIERGMGAGRPYRIRITWLVGETEAEEHDHESMTRGWSVSPTDREWPDCCSSPGSCRWPRRPVWHPQPVSCSKPHCRRVRVRSCCFPVTRTPSRRRRQQRPPARTAACGLPSFPPVPSLSRSLLSQCMTPAAGSMTTSCRCRGLPGRPPTGGSPWPPAKP